MLNRSLGVLVALALLPSPAYGDRCGKACRAEATAHEWPRVALRSCTKACRREERKCRDVPRAERAGCRENNARCTGECGSTWADPALAQDRSFCQLVCNSCKRDGRPLCIAGFRTATRVARCCGGPTDPPCCPRQLSSINECCEAADTCCPSAGCADTQSDARHCGTCGNACGDGQACCGGECVDPRSDVRHCGGCRQACAADETCQEGVCEAACDAPSVLCEVSSAGPRCCSPSDKCCPGAGDPSACQQLDLLKFLFPEAGIAGPDDVTCCRHPNPPAGGETFRACPNGYSCCFQLAGSRAVYDCCKSGETCESQFGGCASTP